MTHGTGPEKLDTWGVVEIFGHQRIAGKLSEQSLAGGNFLRVDVPEVGETPAFTRYFGAGAIYSLTPTTEEVARMAAKHCYAPPVTVHIPELNRLPAGREPADAEFDEVVTSTHCEDCGRAIAEHELSECGRDEDGIICCPQCSKDWPVAERDGEA